MRITMSNIKRASVVFASTMALFACTQQVGSGDGSEGDERAASSEATPIVIGGTLITAQAGTAVGIADTVTYTTKARQAFGPGEYLASRGELGAVGNDAIRSFLVAPAMKVTACVQDNPSLGACQTFVNTTGASTLFLLTAPVAANVSYVKVTPVAIAFRDADFAGAHQVYERGVYQANQGELNVLGNDALSSIRMAPGVSVKLCNDEGAGLGYGDCTTFISSTPNLQGLPINNAASFIRVATEALGYSAAGLTGVLKELPAGTYTLSGGTLSPVAGANAMRSLYLPPGFTALLCTTETGAGCTTFSDTTFGLPSPLAGAVKLATIQGPPIGIILSPANGSHVTAAISPALASVSLRAIAESVAGTPLPASSLTWSVDHGAAVGTGASLGIKLGVGAHTVTLTTRDPSGFTSQSERLVTVDANPNAPPCPPGQHLGEEICCEVGEPGCLHPHCEQLCVPDAVATPASSVE